MTEDTYFKLNFKFFELSSGVELRLGPPFVAIGYIFIIIDDKVQPFLRNGMHVWLFSAVIRHLRIKFVKKMVLIVDWERF